MDYFKLVRFFEEYIAHYREFLEFEYSKLDMINKGEIQKLSNSLSIEQALIAKTNSFEIKRVKLLGDNAHMTFAEIADSAPVSCKSRLTAQHKELSEIVYKIKEINDSASNIVSLKLKRLNSRTAELDTYNGLGNVRREHANTLFVSKV